MEINLILRKKAKAVPQIIKRKYPPAGYLARANISQGEHLPP